MIRAMFMQGLNQRKGLVMFAWLGLLICLISASTIHHHKAGIHLAHACQLCSLEELTTHGSAVTLATLPVSGQHIEIQNTVLNPLLILFRYSSTDIRGSPIFS